MNDRKLFVNFFALFLCATFFACLYGCAPAQDGSTTPPAQKSKSQAVPGVWQKLLNETKREHFSPTEPLVWTLQNGLTVMYVEDKELPIVQGALLIPGGSFYENKNETGLSTAVGDQMRQGGAGKISADGLDLKLEKLSASVSSAVGGEYAKVAFSCLSSDLPEVFQIFTDVIRKPRFDPQRLELWKGQALEGIKRRSDDPGTVASITLGQLLYGSSPFGQVVLQKDIKRLSPEQLKARHEKLIGPQGAILAIAGDVSQKQIAELVTQSFGNWSSAKQTLGVLPKEIKPQVAPGIYFVELPFEQATVMMGQLGVGRLTPDYIAIEGFNEILSGGFSARLFKRIRTEQGLAYSVYGGISPGVVQGVNSVALQTKSDSAGAAIVESLKVLEDLQQNPPDEQELDDVKRTIGNSFLFRFSTPGKLVDRRAVMSLLQYPADYDVVHLGKVDAMTEAEVQSVAKTRWNLSDLIIVVVGNARAYTACERALPLLPEAIRAHGIKRLRFDEQAIL